MGNRAINTRVHNPGRRKLKRMYVVVVGGGDGWMDGAGEKAAINSALYNISLYVS